LAAAASFVALCALGKRLLGALLPQHVAYWVVKCGAALFLAGSCLLAVSRSAALVLNYGAPMQIYSHLPEVGRYAWLQMPRMPGFHLPPVDNAKGQTALTIHLAAHEINPCVFCLQAAGIGPPIAVCTGAEWHRFPSSFFLPGECYRLQFIKSGFTGLLPRQFDASQVTIWFGPSSWLLPVLTWLCHHQ